MNINKRLKDARQSCGLSQREVAEALGMARSTVLRWERGDNLPNNADLATLAKVYQISTEWLREGVGEAPIKDQRRRSAAKNVLLRLLEVDHRQPSPMPDVTAEVPATQNRALIGNAIRPNAPGPGFSDRKEAKRLDAIAGRISLILRSRKDLQSVDGISLELFQAMRAGLVVPNSTLMYQLAEKACVDPELFLIGS